MNFVELRQAAERGIRTVHRRSPGWSEVHTLRIVGDNAILTRAWDIDDGDMNGEEGECVAEVDLNILTDAILGAAPEFPLRISLASRARWTRTLRYSESPTTLHPQSSGPYNEHVSLELAVGVLGVLAVTVLLLGSAQGSPWWLRDRVPDTCV